MRTIDEWLVKSSGEGIPKAVNTIEKITPGQNGLALLPDGKVSNW